MKVLIISLLLLQSCLLLYSQVRIRSFDNNVVTGYTISENEKLITIKNTEGEIFTIPKIEIAFLENLISKIIDNEGYIYFCHINYTDSVSISYIDRRGVTISMNLSEIKSYKIHDNFYKEYIMAGATYGGPGGFNLLLGCQTGFRLNFKLQGNFFSENKALQVNLGVNLYNSTFRDGRNLLNSL